LEEQLTFTNFPERANDLSLVVSSLRKFEGTACRSWINPTVH